MKLLIASAGASDLNAIAADLQRAGLPPAAQAIVLSVADVLPVPDLSSDAAPPHPAVRYAHERAARELADADRAAASVAAELRKIFPAWEITPEVTADAPAWAIIRKAEAWKPDLIVVGSRDRSLIGRVMLGSVAQTVLWQASASVRIAREPRARDDAPVRAMVGIDGSPSAAAAVAAIAARSWKSGTQIRLVTALDWTLAVLLRYTDADHDAASAARRLLQDEAAKLHGLEVSTAVIEGNPKHALLEEAERWNADCVFVGAQGLRGIERLLLGSVSSAIAARAHCSVEVVRL
jgi:nucleotide-binding universal stress UspA family protein